MAAEHAADIVDLLSENGNERVRVESNCVSIALSKDENNEWVQSLTTTTPSAKRKHANDKTKTGPNGYYENATPRNKPLCIVADRTPPAHTQSQKPVKPVTRS